MDTGAWQATVHRVTKSQTWLKWLGTHSCPINEASLGATKFASVVIVNHRATVFLYLQWLFGMPYCWRHSWLRVMITHRVYFMGFKILIRSVLFTKTAFPQEGPWKHPLVKRNQKQSPRMTREPQRLCFPLYREGMVTRLWPQWSWCKRCGVNPDHGGWWFGAEVPGLKTHLYHS